MGRIHRLTFAAQLFLYLVGIARVAEVCAYSAPAQSDFLKPPQAQVSARFGATVAMANEILVVGSPQAPVGSEEQAGAVDVYVSNADVWTHQARLVASVPGAGEHFGAAVSVSHNTIVIGAFGNDDRATNAGAAYVFVREGAVWTQQAVLTASNSEAADYFGWSVAITNDTIVVGAYAEDSDGFGVNPGAAAEMNNSAEGSGAAYVFSRSGTVWSQQAYLKASNTGFGDAFGWSVAASMDTVIVGALLEDGDGTSQSNNSAVASGSAFVFVRNGGTWSQQAYLKASNVDSGDAFGGSVSAAFDSLLIGAPYESSAGVGVDSPSQSDNTSEGAGAAYVIRRASDGSWSQQAYLKATNSDAGDEFGGSVAIAGDLAIVGAANEGSDAIGVGSADSLSNTAPGAGAAYCFTRTGSIWSPEGYLKASNTESDDHFGFSVAAFGENLIAGATGEDSNGTGVNPGLSSESNNSISNAGAAYVFGAATDLTIQQLWRQSYYGTSQDSGAASDSTDPDGDGKSNLVEFAFGTNPFIGTSGPPAIEVLNDKIVADGSPRVGTVPSGTSVNFEAMYGRPKRWQSAGLYYTVQFSGNLTHWVSSTAVPAVVASDDDSEAVTVPDPFFVNGTKARFFRVVIGINPF
jgi:hypothetical protein